MAEGGGERGSGLPPPCLERRSREPQLPDPPERPAAVTWNLFLSVALAGGDPWDLERRAGRPVRASRSPSGTAGYGEGFWKTQREKRREGEEGREALPGKLNLPYSSAGVWDPSQLTAAPAGHPREPPALSLPPSPQPGWEGRLLGPAGRPGGCFKTVSGQGGVQEPSGVVWAASVQGLQPRNPLDVSPLRVGLEMRDVTGGEALAWRALHSPISSGPGS